MRVDGWERLLAEYIEAAHRTPHAWGTNDCALWAAGWVRTATGSDYLADWAGLYQSELGACRLMKKRGYRNPEAVADAHLTGIPVDLARRGDLLLHPHGALGICGGVNGYFLTATGVTTFPARQCPRAWLV